MRKIVFLLVLLTMAVGLQAQYYFSCSHRNYYKYNETTESFDFLNGYDENSLFELNDNLTMFNHTTPTITSAYYIKESSFDEDKEQLTCTVRSDVGNEYIYLFDIKQDEIRVLYEDDGDDYVIIFSVKRMWTE